LDNSKKTWALLPVKAFDRAKTRLRPVLSTGQCSALARSMALDVIDALLTADCLGGVSVLGHGAQIARFARESNCAFIPEIPGSDLSARLDAAALKLGHDGISTLLVVPADLPMLQPVDVVRLMKAHSGGLSVCPATRDGGTNALVISPPGAIGFHFGTNSAQRHLEAARSVKLSCRPLSNTAFSRDIDTPDDLAWFCRHMAPGRTADYLNESGICDNVLGSDTAAIA
jgi:2-phospho-L-lactate guanylyltransferase